MEKKSLWHISWFYSMLCCVCAFSRSLLDLGRKKQQTLLKSLAPGRCSHNHMLLYQREGILVLFFSQTCLGKLYIFKLWKQERKKEYMAFLFSVCLEAVIGLECWKFKSLGPLLNQIIINLKLNKVIWWHWFHKI